MRKAGDYSEKEKRKTATLCKREEGRTTVIEEGQQSLVRSCSPSDTQA